MQINCLFCKDLLFKSFIINKIECKCLKTNISFGLMNPYSLYGSKKESVVKILISNIVINECKNTLTEITCNLTTKKNIVYITNMDNNCKLIEFDFDIIYYNKLLNIIKMKFLL